MKNNTVYLTGAGRVQKQMIEGISVSGNRQSITLDSMEKMRWSAHFSRPCDSFRRMDPPSRYAVAAAEMLGLPESPPDQFRTDVAIVSGTRFGCFGVDAEFFQSMSRPEGASPMLFTYTLPNVPMGELAIRHAITGQNLLLQAGNESHLLALWEAYRLIDRREAAACLVIAADAVPGAGADPLKEHLGDKDREIGQAFAFFMESQSNRIQTQNRILAKIKRADLIRDHQVDARAETVLPGLYQYLDRAPGHQESLVVPSPKTLKDDGVLIVTSDS